MDAAAIRSCVVATLDADANVRKRAELQLKQVRKPLAGHRNPRSPVATAPGSTPPNTALTSPRNHNYDRFDAYHANTGCVLASYRQRSTMDSSTHCSRFSRRSRRRTSDFPVRGPSQQRAPSLEHKLGFCAKRTSTQGSVYKSYFLS